MISLIVLGGAQMLSLRKKQLKEELLRKKEIHRLHLRAQQRPLFSIADHIRTEGICFLDGAEDPIRIYEKMVESMPVENKSAVLKAVLEREQLGGTVIAPGISLPHARLEGLPALFSAMAICPGG